MNEEWVSNKLASELIYASSDLNDTQGVEYARRLSQLGLTPEQINQAYNSEKKILEIRTQNRKMPWACRVFINHETDSELMPKPHELTLTELILITDDANTKSINGYESIKEFYASRKAGCCVPLDEAVYMNEFYDRATGMGWSLKQCSVYITKEFQLAEQIRRNLEVKNPQ